MFTSLLLLSSVALSSVSGQMIKQCTCKEVEPCYENIAEILTQCADRCQNHFSSIGVSYPAARQCIMKTIPKFSQTMECARKNFGDNVCAAAPGPQVPKRYTETMQLAAFREISGMLNQNGLGASAAGLTKVARKAVGCITKCVKAKGCNGKSCGLALPSDNQVVSTFKSCATNTGLLTTQSLQSMCGCLANAGMPQIDDICSKIRVN